jgi:hypothetical protein
LFKSSLTTLTIVLALPYACAPAYRFEAPRAFVGSHFYNPYASASHTWRRANLHAHGESWLGLTSSQQTDVEVAEAYRAHRYSVAVISDYQKIATEPGTSTVPAYEHGYNFGKHHQLALGASRVSWFDFPVWQGVDQKQYVIDQVKKTAALVAIAHPSSLSGYSYSDDDLRQLTGYQLIEVINGRFTAESLWDAALSAGHPVWAIGNDDTHDITDPNRFTIAWNTIDALSNASADILAALQAGRTYATLRIGDPSPAADLTLSSTDIHDGVFSVEVAGPPARFSFIGQNGQVKKVVRDAGRASYTFINSDSYIRTVVETPARILYLNPVVRYDGAALPWPSPTIDPWVTALQRVAVFAVCALLTLSLVRRVRGIRRGNARARKLPRVAALLVSFAAALPGRAQAQDVPRPLPTTVVERAGFESSFDATLVATLPTADSVFSLLETVQAEIVSTRISGGGLGFGAAPRLSVFGSSVTQTEYRIGDINVTDPAYGGTPLIIPELFLSQRVSAAAGLPSTELRTPGLSIGLDPKRAGTAWATTAEASTSFGDALTATASGVAPPIARLTGWNRASVLSGGPIAGSRATVMLAAAWTQASQTERARVTSTDSEVASASAHLFVPAAGGDEFRALVALQRAIAPTANAVFVDRQAGLDDASLHVQSTWAHDDPAGTPWRVFAGYTRRGRTPRSGLAGAAAIERLRDGPPPQQLIDTGERTDGRLSAGARASRTVGQAKAHHVEGGFDIEASRSSAQPGFGGIIGELVDALPARLWQISTPQLTSRRESTSISAFVSDRVPLGARASFDAAVRFERLTASAEGSAQAIAWSTLLPRAAFRWKASDRRAVELFVGAAQSAYQLPLDVLAWGDPAAPSADLFRWNGPAASLAPQPSARLITVGPGRVGRIDPDLRRPYSNDLVFGVESRPRSGVTLQIAGLCKWERRLLGVVDMGSPPAAYSFVNVSDPGLDLEHSTDDQTLHVASLILPTSSYRVDDVLTNAPDRSARRLGAKLTAEVTNDRLYMLFGAAAFIAEGVAASRGFDSSENDQGVTGEYALDPNAGIYARGRLFGDRAFTGKLTTVYRFASDVSVGAIARYQDGQPFARLVVVPGLNQGPDIVRAHANGGSRFTFTATLDLRVQKEFTSGARRVAVFADAYNLLNLAEEVDERVVTGPAFRTPTALQPPRAVRIGARVVF